MCLPAGLCLYFFFLRRSSGVFKDTAGGMREGRRGTVAEPEGVCGGRGGRGRKSSAFSKWKLCFILSFLRLDVSHQSLSSSASSTSHLSPPSRCIHHLPRPPPSRSSAAFHSLRGLAAAFFRDGVLRPLDGIFRSECVSSPPPPTITPPRAWNPLQGSRLHY